MSAPTTSTKIRMERLCRKYRIVFLREQARSEWPAEHREVIKQVKELGERRYESYAVNETVTQEDPWKLQVKERAVVLRELAHRCRSRREATWRSHCESVVFSRFSSEVTCKTCHKRLWRSEIESSRSGEGARARALRRRQELRVPCRCLRLSSGVSRHLYEPAGLNKIFGHRTQEPMIRSLELMKELPMGKEPDAVYGLRQTNNFDVLLNGPIRKDIDSPTEQLLRDTIIPSPMVEDGELLLFPFLIYEAKQESGSDWHSVTLQGAFPIREALASQKSVKDRTGAESRWCSGPFCWYATNRGSDWRVFACFTRQGEHKRGTEGTTDYCIAPLWGGSILTLDSALQLLMITDYIFDWARDIYRVDLIQELQLLSSEQSYTATILNADSDIVSTRPLSPPVIPIEMVTDQQIGIKPPVRQIEFESLDRPEGCIRHAAIVQLRFSSLFLTHNNVGPFIRSLNKWEARSVSRVIVDLRAHTTPLQLALKDLNVLAKWWGGKGRELPSTLSPDTILYTHVLSYSYLAPGWRVVSEICVVALDEEAYDRIGDASNRPSLTKSPCNPKAFRMLIMKLSRLILNSQQVLSDAIYRRCRLYETSSSGVHAELNFSPLKGVLDSLHRATKKDQSRVSDPCLHVFHRFITLSRNTRATFPQNSLHPCQTGNVLIHGTIGSRDLGTRSTVCMFRVKGEPDLPSYVDIRESLEHCFTHHDVFHTTLNNDEMTLQGQNLPTQLASWTWNLENPYGIFTLGNHFIDWIKSLDIDIPITQGALRSKALKKAGRTLLLRELNPWRDPRCQYPDISTHTFLVYKLFSREKAYWGEVAREKASQGIACCLACAAEDEEITGEGGSNIDTSDEKDSISLMDVCLFCRSRVTNPDLPRWLRKPYAGDLISVEPVDDYQLRNRILGLSGIPQEPHLTSMDEWEKNLNFYPKLNEEFKDMDELYEQLAEFQEYRGRRLSSRWGNITTYHPMKRKRGREPDNDDAERGFDNEKAYRSSI